MKPIPFLRILIPFLLGIYLALRLGVLVDLYFLAIIAVVIFLFILFMQWVFFRKQLMMAASYLFIVNLGFFSAQHAKQSHLKQVNAIGNVKQEISYLACLTDLPVEKEQFYKAEIKLNAIQVNGKWHTSSIKLMAYFKKNPNTLKPLPGNTYLIKSKLTEVPTSRNPYEFNYAEYLKNKGIYYNTFIKGDSYAFYKNETELNPVIDLAIKIKYQVIEHLRTNGLNKQAFTISSALLTGYDDEIERSVMNSFAHTGTLHVLSVSGLHTGLIYIFLNFVFNLVDPNNRFKVWRLVCISIILWFFALITGFSPPVLRAVLMFNLFGLGKLYFRSRSDNQLNILLFTAFILLFYNPFWVFDIGFLLSYGAMIGILVISPELLQWLTVKNKIVNYIFESMAVSIAATISTMPLTLFYFNQFPIWFFVCNLVVVPLTFVILMAALISLLNWSLTIKLVNVLVAWMIDFIHFFGNGAYASIENIHFKLRDVFFLFVLIGLIFHYSKHKQFSYAFSTLLLLIAWQLSNLWDSYQSKNSQLLSIYAVKNKSLMAIKNKTLIRFNKEDTLAFNYHIRAHYTRFNYPIKITGPFNFIQSKKEKLLILDKQDSIPLINFSQVTSLVICNNFQLKPHFLKQFLALKRIIADDSNTKHNNSQTENLSRKFGIPFYATRYSGALIMALE